jgi:outer membrane lipoprotein-sorting protein
MYSPPSSSLALVPTPSGDRPLRVNCSTTEINWRTIVQYPTSPIAALVKLAAAFVAAILLAGRGSTALAATDLADPFLNAKTATFTITARFQGHDRNIGKEFISGSAARTEMSHDGMKQIDIVDAVKHVSLLLDPETKQAAVIRTTNLPGNAEMLDQLKQIAKLFTSSNDQQGVKRESLGEQRIDGRKLVGYRVGSESESMELWSDPKTKMPFLMLQRITVSPGVTMETRWSDFQFDVKLDPSLFNVDPPAGYAVNDQRIDASPSTEAKLIKSLKAYTKITDGLFPDSLDAEISIKAFAQTFAPEATTRYTGKGVRLGAKDRPIFWYKPNGATAYRIIYANFSVKENAAPPHVASAVPIGQSKSLTE